MILSRITKDITWQKVVRIHDSYCEWYEKNETIAGLANSVCGENVHFAGLRNLSSNKSVQK